MLRLKDLLNIMDEDTEIVIKTKCRVVYSGYVGMAVYSPYGNDIVINLEIENDSAEIWVKEK